MGGPTYTREDYLWQSFNLTLSSGLVCGKTRRALDEDGSNVMSNFLNCLENINDYGVVIEDAMKMSHKITPQITNYAIRSKLENYLSEKNDVGSGTLANYKQKELEGLINTLKDCCENILKEPDKRKEFGPEAKIFKEVLQYIKR